MHGIKSERIGNWLSRLGLVGLCVFAFQVMAPTMPVDSRTSGFAAYLAKGALTDLVKPGQTIDLCSHSDSSSHQPAAHESCLLCLVSGIPSGPIDLVKPVKVFHHTVESASIHQVLGQRTWPSHLATGPPIPLSV